MNLIEAADAYVQAQREWNEEFLLARRRVDTDGQAKAHADLTVDLLRARLDYEIVLARLQYAHAVLEVEMHSADQSAASTDQDRTRSGRLH